MATGSFRTAANTFALLPEGDDTAGSFPRHRRRLAGGVPAVAHFSARRAAGAAFAGLPRMDCLCLDLITLLRKEMVDHPELRSGYGFPISDHGLVNAAAA